MSETAKVRPFKPFVWTCVAITVLGVFLTRGFKALGWNLPLNALACGLLAAVVLAGISLLDPDRPQRVYWPRIATVSIIVMVVVLVTNSIP